MTPGSPGPYRSKEATLARRYEIGAEWAFFRCLDELRRMRRRAQVARDAEVDAVAGSFLAAREAARREDAEFDTIYGEPDFPLPGRIAYFPYPPEIPSQSVIPVSASRPR